MNGIDPNNNSSWGLQRFSHLHMFVIRVVGITTLMPMGRFFDTIVEVDNCYHAFIYISIQHWFILPTLGLVDGHGQ